MKTKSSCPETFGIKPIFLLLLMLGALWWSGCGNDCIDYPCNGRGMHYTGLDTQYYEYISDFKGSNKFYKYLWIDEQDTGYGIFNMNDVEFRRKVEFDNFTNQCVNEPLVPCDTFVSTLYHYPLTDENGYTRGNYEFVNDAVYYHFETWSFEDKRKRLIQSGISLHLNSEKINKTHLNSDSSSYVVKWHSEFKIHEVYYQNVSEEIHLSKNNDTLEYTLFNKEYLLLKYKNKNNGENKELELVETWN